MAAVAGDVAGFPNGRRLTDDVVDIEIRAVADGYGSFLADTFGLPNLEPNNLVGDGCSANDVRFTKSFPYLGEAHTATAVASTACGAKLTLGLPDLCGVGPAPSRPHPAPPTMTMPPTTHGSRPHGSTRHQDERSELAQAPRPPGDARRGHRPAAPWPRSPAPTGSTPIAQRAARARRRRHRPRRSDDRRDPASAARSTDRIADSAGLGLAAAHPAGPRDRRPSVLDRAERGLHARCSTPTPDDVEATIGLGSIALSRHEFADALELGERAKRRRWRRRPRPLGIQVDALVELGRYDEAGAVLGRMVRTRPDLASYARLSYLPRDPRPPRRGHRRDGARRHRRRPAVENTEYARVLLGDLWLLAGDRERAELPLRDGARAIPGFVPRCAAWPVSRSAAATSTAAIGLPRDAPWRGRRCRTCSSLLGESAGAAGRVRRCRPRPTSS